MDVDVDPLVREYTDGVLSLLDGAAGLFPADRSELAVAGCEVAAPPTVVGSGGLEAVASAAGSDYQRHSAALTESDQDLRAIAAEAAEVARRGGDAVAQLRETAGVQVTALSPGATDSPAGIRALVGSLGGHLDALQGHLDDVKAASAAAAQRLRGLSEGYRQVATPSS